jgi:serine/threonine protein phosphatase PrpC/serine/threonine protein kinase
MGCTQSSIPGESRGRGYSTGMSAVSHSELRYSSSGPLNEDELTERIESSGSNMSFKHNNLRVTGAYVTQRGYYPDDLNKDNQDSYSSIPQFGDGGNQSFFAVYDGHGKDGHLVSRYARDELPKEVLNELNAKVKLRDGSNSLVRGVVQISRGLSESLIAVSNRFSSSSNASKPDPKGASPRTGTATISSLPGISESKGAKATILTEEEVKDALFQAHLKCNSNLRAREGISADLSGTTSISVLLYDNKIYCSNLGDSRAILVSSAEDGKCKVTALSNDQTPYRKDERDRVRKYGARIMSMDQLDGLEPMHDNWQDLTLGEDLDTNGDPPRIWHRTLKVPGTAFTRSIGDFFAETLGVTAEAEISVHPIDKTVRYIIIASDGVFEFLTNKMVADMVEEHDSPIRACQFLVMESYEKWLKEEPRTDDITALVLKIDQTTTSEAKPQLKTLTSSQVGSMLSMPSQVTKVRTIDADESVFPPSPPTSVVSLGDDMKSQKKILRSRKSFIIRPSIDESDEIDVEVPRVSKTPSDMAAVRAAMSCNFLFQYTSEAQREAVIDAMQPIDVDAGQIIIRQGEEGNATEHFYVVYSGRYEVRQNDEVVHVYVGNPATKAHPCFGELSLLCDKPRAASVVALEKGRILSLNRSVFKQVIIGSMDALRSVVKRLHVVPEFRCLSLSQLHLLAMKLAKSETTHASGEQLQTLGAVVNAFAFILSGSARIILSSGDSSNQILSEYKNKTLSKGSCFGVSSLVHAGESHALYSLVTLEATTVQHCSIQDFNLLFGMSLIDLNKAYNEKVALARSPSASAPASFSQIILAGCVSRSEISRSFIGSFNPQNSVAGQKAEPNDDFVGVHTFVISEVSKLQRELGVRTHVEACRILAAGSISPSAFIPKLLSVYKAPNAIHLLYDRALICDLFKLLNGTRSENSPSNFEVNLSACVRYVGACVVSALSVIHAAGIIYRNLNMESLMIDSHGRVSLSDFSLCKIGGVGCKSYTVCGDVNYLSPEQTRLQGHNESVDLWALGVLLYEFVLGEFPFAAANEIATYSKIGAYAADPSRHPLSYSKDDVLHIEVMSIISQLLVGEPSNRLSGNALRAHPFFSIISWTAPEEGSPFKDMSKSVLSDVLKCGMEPCADMLELFVQPPPSDLEI